MRSSEYEVSGGSKRTGSFIEDDKHSKRGGRTSGPTLAFALLGEL